MCYFGAIFKRFMRYFSRKFWTEDGREKSCRKISIGHLCLERRLTCLYSVITGALQALIVQLRQLLTCFSPSVLVMAESSVVLHCTVLSRYCGGRTSGEGKSRVPKILKNINEASTETVKMTAVVFAWKDFQNYSVCGTKDGKGLPYFKQQKLSKITDFTCFPLLIN